MSGLSVRPDGNVSLSVRFAIFTDMSKDGKTAKLFAIQNGRTSRKVGTGDKDCATNAIAAKEITWSLCQDAAELAGVSLKTDDERNAAASLMNNELDTNELLRKQLAQVRNELVETREEWAKSREANNAEIKKLADVVASMKRDVDQITDVYCEPYWLRSILDGKKVDAIKEIGGPGTEHLVFRKNLVEFVGALAKYWGAQ